MTEPTKSPSRIYIRKATAEAFRAFKDKQSTGILPDTGLVAIRGLNKNTGGSSGAGKSSVSHIISYVLGYSPFSANKQQSWLTKTAMQAELELDTPHGSVIIRRGKETSIKVGDEEIIEGSVKAVDARIEKLFGMPIELLSVLTDRKQKKPGLFLSMDDKNKKAFLSKLLGLEELEKVIAKANDSAKASFLVAERHDSAINALQSVIKVPDPLDEASKTLLIGDEHYNIEEIADSLTKANEKMADLKAALEVAHAEHGAFREKLRLESEEVKKEAVAEVLSFDEQIKAVVAARPRRPRVDDPNPELAKWQDAARVCSDRIVDITQKESSEKYETRAIIGTHRSDITRLKSLMAERPALALELANKKKEIAGIEASRCPTCSQQWVAEEGRLTTLSKRCEEIQEKFLAFDQMAAVVTSTEETVKTLEASLLKPPDPVIEELREALQRISNTITAEERKVIEAINLYDAQTARETAELTAKRQEIYTRRSNEKARYFQTLQGQIDADAVTVKRYEGDVSVATNVVYELELALVGLRNKLATAQLVYANQKKAYDETTAKLGAHLFEYDVHNGLAKEEQDFALATKAFMGAIFDEVLVEIADEANDLLRALPNVATTTISFASEKITGKGEVKQEIRPVIMKSGQVIDFEANLSGGQGTSVELAVDLALGGVIGRRTGQRPGWMILDEAFEGHDVPVKEACLEILKKAAEQCAIYVVDHASEVKEYFDEFIDVESEDDVSCIVQRSK